MEKESFTIVNENEHDIVGTIHREKKSGKGPCIIFSPGLLDTGEESYLKTLGKKFLSKGWVVIRFDFTSALGKSTSGTENATITQRVKDLERVVAYAKRRSYVNDSKVVIFGHCYGAMAALAMEGFQHILAGLILVSTPARIEETSLTRKDQRDMMKVKLKRYFHVQHKGKPLRINYEFYEDGIKIDMDRAARNLRTPALFVHGEQDESVPLMNTQRMYNKAVGPKELLVLPKMGHEVKGAAITRIFEASLEFLKKQKIK